MKQLKNYLLFLFFLTAVKADAQTYSFKGSWITNTEDTAASQAPYFRKVFSTEKKIKKATAYVCGVGYHITYINGKHISDNVLDQAFTRYDKRLLYKTYNVTSLLQKGKNCIAAELGNSWFNQQSRTIWYFDKRPWRKTPRLLLNIVIEYTDGTKDLLTTDDTWKCSTGPSQFNSMHAGEIYDARKEIKGWNQAVFNDNTWQNAKVTVSPGGELEPQTFPPVAVIRHIHPVSVKSLGNGKWLFNMGQNFAGVATLRIHGKAGDTVIMHYGEVLTKDGTVNLETLADIMNGPPTDLHFQTDMYILSGNGNEIYTPRFTYHGFQYVQVETNPNIKLDKNSLEGLFYSTDFKSAGSFNSSDTMLNKLYAAAIQSYRSNFINIPTDCPSREKMGWTADAHISSELGLWNFDAASGYRAWLRDVHDVQLPDGRLPGIAPTNGIGYHFFDPKEGFGPAWDNALIQLTWYLYLYENDTATMRENYDAIKKLVDQTNRRAEKFIYPAGLGDWEAIQETPIPFTSTAYFYTGTKQLSKMAAILGNRNDEERYGKLADSIKIAFNAQFFDAEKGMYKDTTLTALSAAIFHNLCPEQSKRKVAAALRAGVEKRNYHADFGLLGTKYILSVLSDAGYIDDAYKLLTDTGFAGWGHWIAHGATTLFEDWYGKDSHNHVFFGDFAAWYFKYLAGIKLDENSPGFKHFTISPVFPSKLNSLSVTHETKYGQIAVSWKRKGKDIELSITVPPQTIAEVVLLGNTQSLKAGKQVIQLSL